MTKYLLIAACSVASAGCDKGSDATLDADKQFVVENQQTVVVATPAGKPQLSVTSITDSRCPTGGQCIWAGQAAVRVRLKEGVDSAQVVQLYLGQGLDHSFHTRDSAVVTLASKPYWLYLLAVDPYPNLDTNGATKKTATLRLTLR